MAGRDRRCSNGVDRPLHAVTPLAGGVGRGRVTDAGGWVFERWRWLDFGAWLAKISACARFRR